MRNLVVFSGSSHPELVANISQYLCIAPGKAELAKFKNGETSVTIKDSVRNKDVYVVQSANGSVNDMFLELLIIISACKSASAKRVTAVLPLFPYSRQPDSQYMKSSSSLVSNRISHDASKEITYNEDNTHYKAWVAQTGTLVADLLTTAGADHIITMDLHDAQFQGFFDIPVDNLYSKPLLVNYITQNVANYRNCVIVSPDSGGAKRAIAVADQLGLNFALIHKEKRSLALSHQHSMSTSFGLMSPGVKENTATSYGFPQSTRSTTMLVGDVKDRDCIIIDDMVDTSMTIIRAAKILKDQGAQSVIAIITHGVFSGEAIDKIKRSSIDKIVVSDSLPQVDNFAKFPEGKFEVLNVSKIFGEAIRRIHNGESVRLLFDNV